MDSIIITGVFEYISIVYKSTAIANIIINCTVVSKASIIISPMPILVAFFAYLILGEIFTIYHLIGVLIVIGSIIIIMRKKE